jgi:hypothetical protein
MAGTELDTDDGPLTVGACVSVDFEGSTAEEIESEPAARTGPTIPLPRPVSAHRGWLAGASIAASGLLLALLG